MDLSPWEFRLRPLRRHDTLLPESRFRHHEQRMKIGLATARSAGE